VLNDEFNRATVDISNVDEANVLAAIAKRHNLSKSTVEAEVMISQLILARLPDASTLSEAFIRARRHVCPTGGEAVGRPNTPVTWWPVGGRVGERSCGWVRPYEHVGAGPPRDRVARKIVTLLANWGAVKSATVVRCAWPGLPSSHDDIR
jgi:hypothetical protein